MRVVPRLTEIAGCRSSLRSGRRPLGVDRDEQGERGRNTACQGKPATEGDRQVSVEVEVEVETDPRPVPTLVRDTEDQGIVEISYDRADRAAAVDTGVAQQDVEDLRYRTTGLRDVISSVARSSSPTGRSAALGLSAARDVGRQHLFHRVVQPASGGEGRRESGVQPGVVGLLRSGLQRELKTGQGRV
ncbi:hypothetical protein AB0D11_47855 [Streptomyces monashensis]|uniref:hypothetical protein n=1 Tax=Streptomyces monashensis TaxID=1678012 RepID=UPI0033DF8AC3